VDSNFRVTLGNASPPAVNDVDHHHDRSAPKLVAARRQGRAEKRTFSMGRNTAPGARNALAMQDFLRT